MLPAVRLIKLCPIKLSPIVELPLIQLSLQLRGLRGTRLKSSFDGAASDRAAFGQATPAVKTQHTLRALQTGCGRRGTLQTGCGKRGTHTAAEHPTPAIPAPINLLHPAPAPISPDLITFDEPGVVRRPEG